MNNISEFMNKIDIRSSSDLNLLLESMGVVTLGSFWDRITLSGDYWRFYFHNAPGAGVIVNGRKKSFLANRCYLLPPSCDLESFCNASAEQLFIHAELRGCRAAFAGEIILLPEEFDLEPIKQLRDRILAGKAGTPAVRLAALSIISQALAYLPETIFTAPAMDSRITMLRDYINTHLEEDIALDFLAKRCGMSREAMIRLFKDECGITPYQYLLQQRYNCAARLLKNSNLPIENICDSVGFKDRFHFSRQFKKLFGMPPAAYRSYYRRDFTAN